MKIGKRLRNEHEHEFNDSIHISVLHDGLTDFTAFCDVDENVATFRATLTRGEAAADSIRTNDLCIVQADMHFALRSIF